MAMIMKILSNQFAALLHVYMFEISDLVHSLLCKIVYTRKESYRKE